MSEKPVKRATMKQLLAFCNKVRRAGGGNPLDALMPAVPADPYQCLVAANLNFNCDVRASGGKWFMEVSNREVAERICESLNLDSSYPPYEGYYRIYLPERIGKVAADFDKAQDILGTLGESLKYHRDRLNDEDALERALKELEIEHGDLTAEKKKLVTEMWPYIQEAVRETYGLATLINDDGSIVL